MFLFLKGLLTDSSGSVLGMDRSMSCRACAFYGFSINQMFVSLVLFRVIWVNVEGACVGRQPKSQRGKKDLDRGYETWF